MAALASTHPTLLDVVKRTDENGNIANVIEILNQSNDMLDDMVWIQCNNGVAHKTTMRSGIPEPTFRKLYGGVQPSKSRTVSIMDNCGMMENYAEIDKALADMNGNTAAWRLSEELPIIEGFNQKLSRYAFYGNEATEPEGFTGLAPRFNTITGVENKDNVLKAAAGTAITSLWLVVWGPNTVHMIYPNGSQAGLYSGIVRRSRELVQRSVLQGFFGRHAFASERGSVFVWRFWRCIFRLTCRHVCRCVCGYVCGCIHR